MSQRAEFSPYQQFIAISRYARWLDDKKRRETWPETVARYFDFFEEHLAENHGYKVPKELRAELEEAVVSLEVMPSMRCLMTAGPALKKSNAAGFNCCYCNINHLRAFDELMYLLMCGSGVGFSVESEYVNKLPTICDHMTESETTIVVEDSREGWVKAYRELISLLVSGQIPKWDLSRLRPAGARLKTFGGRSSGPEPLERLFKWTTNTFRKASGRKLTPLECHDICCFIADIVVVGGVRRSALISLSDLNDIEMRNAKSGDWRSDESKKQRDNANNSAVYNSKPKMEIFIEEWVSLYKSHSGERGIFNLDAVRKHIKKGGRRDETLVVGSNPCNEVLLRNGQMCNLSEIIVRPWDTIETLARKARIATIFGTWQSTLTNFSILRPIWKKNCEEERLLGVSLTGIMDNPIMRCPGETPALLEYLKTITIDANKEMADTLGINHSTAITCVKPSGTVSELADCAPGIHTRYANTYLRRVRADIKDPLCEFMIEAGFPHEKCVRKPDAQAVFEFPVACLEAFTRHDLTAVQHLDLWLMYQRHYCCHKPSITISVREHEWLEVGNWVYQHFDEATGISFLPFDDSDHVYQQAPYEECSEETYLEKKKVMDSLTSKLDWNRLAEYEQEDNTVSSQTLACTGNSCSIVDLVK